MSDRFGKDKNKSTDANFFPGNTDDEKISRLCIKFTKITGSINSFKKKTNASPSRSKKMNC